MKSNAENNRHHETIAALATAQGRGGIAIVRVSGPKVREIMSAVLHTELKPREATFLSFYDQDHTVIDEGVAIFFPNPHSFTGEDVIELHGHGGPIVVDLLLACLINVGARLARPGEFSERAFLNGKIDLTQAEAIADLIDASSKHAAKLALKSLQGEFSKVIKAINEQIIQLRIYVEAAIDFADEEIDFLNDKKISEGLKQILENLISIQNKSKQGSFLREGITIVIAGVPNVGKSSLLNSLSAKEIAIVSDIPGTTRDVLRDYILIDGMPVHIIDTAGLRDSEDVIEQEGVRRAYREIENADIILYMLDASNPQDLSHTISKLNNQSILFIRNKIDLTNEQPQLQIENDKVIISLSAKQQIGIDLLKEYIKSKVGFQNSSEGIYLARRRHLEALSKAYSHVEASLNQFYMTHAYELMAEDLRLAHLALSEITGQFSADDLLGKIFSSFCIGK